MKLLVNDGHADIVIHRFVHGLVFGQDVVAVQDYRNDGDADFDDRVFGNLNVKAGKHLA